MLNTMSCTYTDNTIQRILDVSAMSFQC